jgi:hypothetical protein
MAFESDPGHGYASTLLHHVYNIALKDNCHSVQLDSGHARIHAHRLRYKENFFINPFH